MTSCDVVYFVFSRLGRERRTTLEHNNREIRKDQTFCFRFLSFKTIIVSLGKMLSIIAKSMGKNLSPKGLQYFSTSQQKCQNLGNHLWNLKSGPPPALALGAAGLIPFMSAPAYMLQINEFVPLIAQGNS